MNDNLILELRDAAKLYDDAGLDGSLGADMCRRAADALEAMQWQSIETAPKDGTPIDLWHTGKFRCENCWWDGAWIGAPDDNVTHWMPLPNPPEEEK